MNEVGMVGPDDREMALLLCLDLTQPVACLLATLAQLQITLTQQIAAGVPGGEARTLGWVESAYASADQMARVLAEGRAQILRDHVRVRRFDLRTVLRSAIAMCAGEAAGRAEVVFEAPEPIWIAGSTAQLVQAFCALLLHFSVRHAGGQKRVVLRLRAEGGRALVELQRNAGASLERDVVLTPQADPASLALGLLRARRIFAEHQGQIDFDDAGERARVGLPLAAER